VRASSSRTTLANVSVVVGLFLRGFEFFDALCQIARDIVWDWKTQVVLLDAPDALIVESEHAGAS